MRFVEDHAISALFFIGGDGTHRCALKVAKVLPSYQPTLTSLHGIGLLGGGEECGCDWSSQDH